MAKDRFYPSKPHVNVARQRLRKVGMSLIGIDQVLNGRPVLQLEDCRLVSQIVLAAAAQIEFDSRSGNLDGTARQETPV